MQQALVMWIPRESTLFKHVCVLQTVKQLPQLVRLADAGWNPIQQIHVHSNSSRLYPQTPFQLECFFLVHPF